MTYFNIFGLVHCKTFLELEKSAWTLETPALPVDQYPEPPAPEPKVHSDKQLQVVVAVVTVRLLRRRHAVHTFL